MDERTHRVGAASPPPKETPAALEQEVHGLREALTVVVGELDHRRHDLLDWRAKLRAGAGKLALVGAGALALTLAAVWLRRRAHRAHRWRNILRYALAQLDG